MSKSVARFCIVGQLLGRNTGYVTTQGQVLADHFSLDGYTVISTSSKLNRVFRLLDIVYTVIRANDSIELLIIEVYSGWSFVLADVTSLMAKFFRLPTILVLHGGNLPQFSNHYPRWVKRVLNRANRIVAPSEYLKREICNIGFDVQVIPNILAAHNYPFTPRRQLTPRLLWMRSFHEIYNPLMAIRALSLVKRKYPRATLVMAGPDKGHLGNAVALARELGLQNSVRFAGFLDDKAKVEEFSAADIYLHTNRVDNMPVSVVEAAAFGLPIVACDVGGIPDLLTDRKTGILVQDNDHVGMSEAICLLLENVDLAEVLSNNGRKLAEESDWSNVKRKWVRLFDELAATPIGPKTQAETLPHRRL